MKTTNTEVMRMIVELPKNLHRKAKAVAALRGMSIKQLLIAGLNQQLEESMDCLECKDSEFNEETIRVMDEVRRGEGIVKAKNAKDLFKKLRE